MLQTHRDISLNLIKNAFFAFNFVDIQSEFSTFIYGI